MRVIKAFLLLLWMAVKDVLMCLKHRGLRFFPTHRGFISWLPVLFLQNSKVNLSLLIFVLINIQRLGWKHSVVECSFVTIVQLRFIVFVLIDHLTKSLTELWPLHGRWNEILLLCWLELLRDEFFISINQSFDALKSSVLTICLWNLNRLCLQKWSRYWHSFNTFLYKPCIQAFVNFT
jgi:hypothetical protein